jgi:hypothetical protein
MVLWRELKKIPQGETNKSANRWGNLRVKGRVVLPSVYCISSHARVRIKYISPTRLRFLFLLATVLCYLSWKTHAWGGAGDEEGGNG